MTDHDLQTVLYDVSLDIPVPPAPLTETLARGRGYRRRRRTSRVAVAAAVLVVAAGSVTYATTRPDHATPAIDVSFTPVAHPAKATKPTIWAVATGSEVRLSNGHIAKIPGKVDIVTPTSVGFLARSITSTKLDCCWLVRPDGHVTRPNIGTDAFTDNIPGSGTDPTLPYVALTSDAGNDWRITMHDLRDGTTATTIRVPKSAIASGGQPDPILIGEHLYIDTDDAMVDLDWHTGKVNRVHEAPWRSGDVATVYTKDGQAIKDLHTGRVHVPDFSDDLPRNAWSSMSPTGAYFASGGATCAKHAFDPTSPDSCLAWKPGTLTVTSIADGHSRTINVDHDRIGWTSNDHLLVVGKDGHVRVLDPRTLDGRTTQVTVPAGSDLPTFSR